MMFYNDPFRLSIGLQHMHLFKFGQVPLQIFQPRPMEVDTGLERLARTSCHTFNMCVCMYIYIYVCRYVVMYVCMYVYVCNGVGT